MPVDHEGSRHYQGPEQPKAPPPVSFNQIQDVPFRNMPPADDLVSPAPVTERMAGDASDDMAFEEWLKSAAEKQPNPKTFYGIAALLREAFDAGVRYAKASAPPHLEGTVETRTIIAALQMFKEQILVGNPEEVQTGEWLAARDVDALIANLRRR